VRRQADNGFRARAYGTTAAQALVAVLAGNALYFLVLAPRLPAAWRHQPFALDLGLLLDFLLCALLYALLHCGRRWFDSRRRRH
jgi:hypothetical protein